METEFTQFTTFHHDEYGDLRVTYRKADQTAWFAVMDICNMVKLRNVTATCHGLNSNSYMIVMCNMIDGGLEKKYARYLALTNIDGILSILYKRAIDTTDIRTWVITKIIPKLHEHTIQSISQVYYAPPKDETIIEKPSMSIKAYSEQQVLSLANEIYELLTTRGTLAKDISILEIQTYIANQAGRNIINAIQTAEEFSPKDLFCFRDIPDFTGCYIIWNQSKDIYYIGQSKNVLTRLKNHFTGHSGNSDVFHDYNGPTIFSV